MTGFTPFRRLALIGIGLIGSSIARIAAREGLAETIVCAARREETRAKALELGIVSEAHLDPAEAVKGADCVILCTPLGAYAEVMQRIAPHLQAGAILSDVGSVKAHVVKVVDPHLPPGVSFIPGHPIAGTEHSGPAAGFAELFEGRWTILTPLPGWDEAAAEKLSQFWASMGAMVETMEPIHHDQVLAITSHLPHLIAYTIVGTATGLEEHTQREVIKFSASGFRDFTRIAASNPIMWRDIFLNNREAVLEMLGRFSEDLTALQRAIRWGEGDTLYDLFDRARRMRREVIEAGQDTAEPNWGREN